MISTSKDIGADGGTRMREDSGCAFQCTDSDSSWGGTEAGGEAEFTTGVTDPSAPWQTEEGSYPAWAGVLG